MNSLRYNFTHYRWFSYAFLLLFLALLYTLVFMSGVLLYPTLRIEQWLLYRPLTGVDCVLRDWVSVFQVGVSLVVVTILGFICILLGYRRRMLSYLLLLLLLGIGIEFVGKQVLPFPVPQPIERGLLSLRCPELPDQSPMVRLSIAAGMWWVAPEISYWDNKMLQRGKTTPLVIDDSAYMLYGYPSGHALRSSFLGLLLCWLCWRHIRRKWLRRSFVLLMLIVAFSGGFIQFYLGIHLSTDVIVGYLLGFSVACCAIGLLQRNKKQPASPVGARVDVDEGQGPSGSPAAGDTASVKVQS